MPDQLRDDIIEVVHAAVESAINKRIVNALVWIIGIGMMNFLAIVSGIALFYQTQHKLTDRWTGTMEQFSEYSRTAANPGYHGIDVREIQQRHYPE